jgi:UDP-N-acetyl-D-galactosamine dehydrogenase
LGYVGLPLAVAFGEKRSVVGFDINTRHIAELKQGEDFTREVSAEEHEYGISLMKKPEQGAYSSVIVAVPHKEYAGMSAGDLRGYLKAEGVLFDLKGVLPLGEADFRL